MWNQVDIHSCKAARKPEHLKAPSRFKLQKENLVCSREATPVQIKALQVSLGRNGEMAVGVHSCDCYSSLSSESLVEQLEQITKAI